MKLIQLHNIFRAKALRIGYIIFNFSRKDEKKYTLQVGQIEFAHYKWIIWKPTKKPHYSIFESIKADIAGWLLKDIPYIRNIIVTKERGIEVYKPIYCINCFIHIPINLIKRKKK